MFTGIVEEVGTVAEFELRAEDARLTVTGPLVVSDAELGASIAVDGVCLTVVSHDETGFTVDVMAETLACTGIGALTAGSRVNLERAMRADGRFGGHLVQGHVDGVGTIRRREEAQRWTVVEISLPPELARYVVAKGSIAVDGISLTVASRTTDGFTVSLIPTTLAATTLGHKGVGDSVNLETDVLAKYLESMTPALLHTPASTEGPQR